MYAFAEGEKANVIVRPNDIERCMEVLEGIPGLMTQF
jgi:hypothetical protein